MDKDKLPRLTIVGDLAAGNGRKGGADNLRLFSEVIHQGQVAVMSEIEAVKQKFGEMATLKETLEEMKGTLANRFGKFKFYLVLSK